MNVCVCVHPRACSAQLFKGSSTLYKLYNCCINPLNGKCKCYYPPSAPSLSVPLFPYTCILSRTCWFLQTDFIFLCLLLFISLLSVSGPLSFFSPLYFTFFGSPSVGFTFSLNFLSLPFSSLSLFLQWSGQNCSSKMYLRYKTTQISHKCKLCTSF